MITSFLKAASIIATAAVTAVSADCSNFQKQGVLVRGVPEDQGQQVTAGVTCDRRECTIPLQGSVHANRYTNITSIPDTELSWLYDLAFDSFPKNAFAIYLSPHKESLYSCLTDAPTDRYTWPVARGFSGYVEIFPIFACVRGTVSGCSGSGLQDGDSARVCFPRDHGSPGHLRPEVAYHPVHTSRAEALDMKLNPAEGNGDQACKRASSINSAPSGRLPGSTSLIASWAGILVVLLQFL